MNLFVLDDDPALNAQYHADKHVGKMFLEATQLLCGPFHLQGISAPYKLTHQNHPCALFCRASLENYLWVFAYAEALALEFQFRRGKVHKTSEVLSWVSENRNRLAFPLEGRTPFALAMPEQYREGNAVSAYRNYYKGEKQHLFQWTGREGPPWI